MWKLWKVRLVNRGPKREEETRTIPTKKDKDEAGKEAQCRWLKKQHRLLMKKWHPDKAKGNARRAAGSG